MGLALVLVLIFGLGLGHGHDHGRDDGGIVMCLSDCTEMRAGRLAGTVAGMDLFVCFVGDFILVYKNNINKPPPPPPPEEKRARQIASIHANIKTQSPSRSVNAANRSLCSAQCQSADAQRHAVSSLKASRRFYSLP